MAEQGGFGLQFKIDGAIVVNMVDIDELRFLRTFAEITGHDSEEGYYEEQPSGRQRIDPFNCTLVWDASRATHEAMVLAFSSNTPSAFTWADPNTEELISFDAFISSIGRVMRQDDVYKANVQILPNGAPTIQLPYYKRVLATNPIAYFPLWDASGSAAESLITGIPNGTVSGATMGHPGIGDGKTSFYFDGVQDTVDIYSSALNTAIGAWGVGSAMIWVKPDTGYWITGYRDHLTIECTDSAERMWLQQGYAGDRLSWVRQPGTNITNTGYADANWFCMAVVFNATNSYAYKDGSQQVGAGAAATAWLTPLNSSRCRIGSQTATGAVMLGWLAHAVLWDYVLTPAQILDLAVV